MKVKYEITDDLQVFKQSNEIRINYSNDFIDETVQIIPSGLLFDDSVAPQDVYFKILDGLPVLFSNERNENIGFDVFSAAFYMLSRYEEYLEFKPDEHGRFPLKESLSFRHDFYERAIVHHWVDLLINILEHKYEHLSVTRNSYRFVASFDIDNAYAYLHKNWFRTIGGLAKDLLTNQNNLKDRINVIRGKQKDPYDNYDFILENSKQLNGKPLFFILTSDDGKFDKNISPKHPAFEKLVSQLKNHGEISIHPSYQSHDSIQKLKSEINTLRQISQKEISFSRQHFIKLRFPQTFENLIASGISDDYSLGYPEASGFRSGCAVAYPFFNLKKNETSELMLHPFYFMDATYLFYQKMSFEDIMQRLKQIIDEVKAVQGTFYPLWHNECFGGEKANEWRELLLWTHEYARG